MFLQITDSQINNPVSYDTTGFLWQVKSLEKQTGD